MLRIAIVGCGKIADAHAEEIRKQANAQLVGVCDLEPLMAEQLAVRYGINEWHSDVASMMKALQPDVLHITTPPHSHPALVRHAVSCGAHVFLEKPVALSHPEVQDVVATVRASGKKLAVNYWPEFEVQAVELRRLVAEGILGDAVHVESHMGYNLTGDFGTAIRQDPNHWVRRMPGQLFQNMFDHIVNRVVPFMQDQQPKVDCFAYTGGSPGSEGIDLLDELRAVVRGANTTAYLTFTAHSRPVGNLLRVYGTRNTATLDYNARTIVLERPQAFPSAVGRLFPAFQTSRDYFKQGLRNLGRFRRARFHFFDGMRTLLTDFYSSIENDAPSPTSDEHILRVSSIMQQIYDQVYPTHRESTLVYAEVGK